MKTSLNKLYSYIPMANFIAEMNGPHAEALIHDLSDIEHSIIYITPKNITGRRVNGTLTDYAVQLLNDRVYEKSDYVVNYIGRPSHEELMLRASTYFIKEEGRLIGLLCVNVDITNQVYAIKSLKEALLVDINESQPLETFSLSTDELIHRVVAKRIKKQGREKLSVAQRKAIVSELAAFDVFMVKGTIPKVAALLEVSTQTIYRYIAEIKNNKKGNAE